MSQTFTQSAVERLRIFLKKHNETDTIEILTPDASTREYFRVNWRGETAIACLYPESFLEKEHNYLDVTNLFVLAGLPVAAIFTFDASMGVIVLEDLGDVILRDVLNASKTETKEKLLNESITLIAKIQAATDKAFELNSIASRLKFDREKLRWELNFFKEHYFKTFRQQGLSKEIDLALNSEFTELSQELEQHAKVLCHRDFHAANIMIDKAKRLRIIDHQDARIGAASYDLVSLLLDRIVEPPEKIWLDNKKRFFLREREKLDLEKIEFDDFDYEFDLMTVQRCLKAVGTFSFQSVNRGKTRFVQYIVPMLGVVSAACGRLQRFPVLQKIIKENTLKTNL